MATGRGLLLLALLAGCGGGRQGSPPGGDAGRDAEQAPADAAPESRDAGDSSVSGGHECGWPELACLGHGCAAFQASEGTGVRVEDDGALALEEGVAEGELRHVFEGPCEEQGASTQWHSLTATGSLQGVGLEVRGAWHAEDLESAEWQVVESGAPLPSFGGAGCGPSLLEVRIRLHAVDGAQAPRVDGLSFCYGCTLTFC